METKKKAEKLTQQTLLGFIKKSEKKKEPNSPDFPYTPSKSSDLSSFVDNGHDGLSELEAKPLNSEDSSFSGIFTPVTLNIDQSKREESRANGRFSSFHASPSLGRVGLCIFE